MFFGWFGRRGLATAPFALLVVSDIDDTYAEPVLAIAINAVWIRTLPRGLSVVPGASNYAERVRQIGALVEMEPIDQSAKPLKTQN